MEAKFSYHNHRPPHIFIVGYDYFITGRILDQQNLLAGAKKKIFLSVLKSKLIKYEYKCYAWVVLDNHYHILIKTGDDGQIAEFIRELHAGSAKVINKNDGTKGRPVWYQYWDHGIRNKGDFIKHFNYIHHNPVKHHYVKYQDDVFDYQYCSYRQWVNKKGKGWVDSCFDEYSIIDFMAGE